MRTRFYPPIKKPTFKVGCVAALIVVATALTDLGGIGWLTIVAFAVFYVRAAVFAVKGHIAIAQAQSSYRDALIDAGEWSDEKEQIFFDMWSISAQADVRAVHEARPFGKMA